MKCQPVEFLEWVEPDLNHAQDFYDSWLTGGADKFIGRFREAVTWIEWNPEQFPIKHRFFRRAIIRRTYFGIYFAIEPAVTTVVAVLDIVPPSGKLPPRRFPWSSPAHQELRESAGCIRATGRSR